ncbi:YhcN/YlaJ family sporulation lipoprotein [Virgibacillus sp. DJP39]|uniref:YhcN/YlaJ family sporulation lipoprotein n=1 Tax=Virgibacillus sp. DJP39 TaxID=3409790 RepID=UPI003BB5EECE
MKLNYVCLLFIVIVMTACSDGENSAADNNNNEPQSQPLNYENETEKNRRLGLRDQTIGEKGGYSQSDQKLINRGDVGANNKDIYTNEKSQEIVKYLMDRHGIKVAQVAITDEKIIVAVMFDDRTGTNDAIADVIEKEVRKFDASKQIVVYTDQSNWEQVKDLKARPNQ